MSMRTVSLLLLLLSAPVPVLGETLIIPFDVHRTKSVLLVEAQVNGKKARLILDTGASSTLLSIDLGSGARLAAESRFARRGPGIYAEASWSEVDLTVGSRKWSGFPIGWMDFAAVREIYGREVDGILGQDLMQEFDSVVIDYRARTVTLSRR
jgi:hypothetical protein